MQKIILSLFLLIFITACTAKSPAVSDISATNSVQNTNGYPSPQGEYPAPTGIKITETGKSDKDYFVYPEISAFSALPVAEAEAKKWKPGAVLYQIPRLRQMETNLGLPKGPSGWFFAFMNPTDGSDVEYYVEVINNEVAGKNEVQQLFGGEPPYRLAPIDMNKQLLDSTDVFKMFLANGGEEYVKGKGRVEIDFQLVRLEGMENPVWSIYDIADPNAAPLINVDAVTGNLVEDPFKFLR